VVLQSESFTLETVVVAPLDDQSKLYEDDPLTVEISAKEAGARGSQVVLVAHLMSIVLDRFEPGVVGRLRRASLMRVEDAIVRLFESSDAV
jgi:kynureninase